VGALSGRDHVLLVVRALDLSLQLRVETGGSSDACAWIPEAELGALPLVELARVGMRLAGLGRGSV